VKLGEGVRRITDGYGADIVIDGIGGDVLSETRSTADGRGQRLERYPPSSSIRRDQADRR
jgi:hypothetical protein